MFGIAAIMKGLCSPVKTSISSTGFVYDFFAYGSDNVCIARYNPSTGQVTVKKLNTDTAKVIDVIINSNKFPINERYAYGKDINDLLTCGIYTTGGTLPSNSEMKNYPVDVTAHIIVITSTQIITQMFITHDLSYFYIRGKYRTHAFSSWKQVQISK